MKKSDCFGIVFFVILLLFIFFFPFAITGKITMNGCFSSVEWTGFSTNGIRQFGTMTAYHPYLMGFLKFAFLAMFGEMLKNRMKTGSWKTDLFLIRVITWGLFGMLMTLAFALFANGMKQLMETPIWFQGNNLVFAFSTSLWMNLIFAYPMMLGHEWFNVCFAKRKLVGGEKFLELINKHVWGSFIPKTILYFWIPAHTVTFLIPAQYRVLMGALLSIALGFILTVKAVKKS